MLVNFQQSGAPGSHKLVEVVWVHWPVEPRGSAMEGSPITLLSRVHLVGNIHETDHSLHSLRESMPPRRSTWTWDRAYCDCITEKYGLIRYVFWAEAGDDLHSPTRGSWEGSSGTGDICIGTSVNPVSCANPCVTEDF